MKINCFTCKYGYEDERLGILMCHHPRRFSEDCVNFNMHEEKEIKESENLFKEPIDGVLYAATCGIKNKEQIEESEKPIPADVEEAAKKYVSTLCDRVDEGLKIDTTLESAFKAGAEWHREYMIKEAVEGRVFMSFAPGHNQMVMADVDLPTNTKVRVIVLPKED